MAYSHELSLLFRMVTRSAGIGPPPHKMEGPRYPGWGGLASRAAPERSDGGSPPVIPRDAGRRFREDSEKWPTSGRNQWPRSVGMGGRLASESVAGLGRNTQRV